MSIYTHQIEHIMQVYTQQAKSRDKSRAAAKTTSTFEDTVQFSMSATKKKTLEKLALETVDRLTRRNTQPQPDSPQNYLPELISKVHEQR